MNRYDMELFTISLSASGTLSITPSNTLLEELTKAEFEEIMKAHGTSASVFDISKALIDKMNSKIPK